MNDSGPGAGKLSERYFFALWPEPEIQQVLEHRGHQWVAVAGGRATAASSIHMTLAFLGELSPGAEELKRAQDAAATCTFPPFVLTVADAGYFRRKGVAWVGPRDAPPALASLAEDLRAALDLARVGFDPQPFVPHITVLRGARRFEVAPRAEPLRWSVDRFALMASVPSGGRRTYFQVASWPASPGPPEEPQP